jgi:hypothetical protein
VSAVVAIGSAVVVDSVGAAVPVGAGAGAGEGELPP